MSVFVSYFSADGDYTVTLMTKVRVRHDGRVHWEPPAIYKSYCNINVDYFPFDEQKCLMQFGTWTYTGVEVGLNMSPYSKGACMGMTQLGRISLNWEPLLGFIMELPFIGNLL